MLGPELPTDVSTYVALEAAFNAMVDVEGDLHLAKYELRKAGAVPDDSKMKLITDLDRMCAQCSELQEMLKGHRAIIARRIREAYE